MSKLSTILIMWAFVPQLCCTPLTCIMHGESKITDHTLFPFHTIDAAENGFRYARSDVSAGIRINGSFLGQNETIDQVLEKTQTIAFLVVHNDSLLWERYFSGYHDTSLVVAFSMTKTFFSVLFGCAVDDGIIGSIEDRITAYLPEMSDGLIDTVRIRHLLDMTSGLHYKEPTGNPFALHNRLYWGDNLEGELKRLRQIAPSGESFRYKSLDTQLLGIILTRALKFESISDYMERRVWKPMGMEYDALWSTDENGEIEKVFSSITGRPRDFIKFGSLVMDSGRFNNRRIVSKEWFPHFPKESNISYHNGIGYKKHWWFVENKPHVLLASGHLGQYLYLDSEKKIAILRMGTERGLKTAEWIALFDEIVESIDETAER